MCVVAQLALCIASSMRRCVKASRHSRVLTPLWPLQASCLLELISTYSDNARKSARVPVDDLKTGGNPSSFETRYLSFFV